MLEKVKIINKKEDINLSFDLCDFLEVIEKIKLIPIGINELIPFCSYLPILIAGKNFDEFVVYGGIDIKNTMFHNIKLINIPALIRAYPFFAVKTQENSSVIALDDTKHIGKNKQYKIFENGSLSKIAQNKINILNDLSNQRELSKTVIKELKKYDLLKKHKFTIKNNGKELIILDNYYIVNEKKLENLNDEVLAVWAKKGWMGIIDAHIYSINNFSKLLYLVQNKKGNK